MLKIVQFQQHSFEFDFDAKNFQFQQYSFKLDFDAKIFLNSNNTVFI